MLSFTTFWMSQLRTSLGVRLLELPVVGCLLAPPLGRFRCFAGSGCWGLWQRLQVAGHCDSHRLTPGAVTRPVDAHAADLHLQCVLTCQRQLMHEVAP